MNEHLHIHKKTGFQTASQPQQSQFQSRTFVVQPQTEEQSEQPDIKTALQRAERYGHRLDRIKFSEAPVQRPVPRIVQAKLTIGEPGDRYEQEADSVAASVVQQINAPDPQQSTQSQSVQREATPDEEDELMKKPDISAIQRKEEQEEEIQAKPEITALQRQEEPEEEIQAKPNVSDLMRSPLPSEVQREAMPEEEELQTKSILQRREAIGGGEASTDLESAINSSKGGGQPLEASLQRSMGQAMGADFSGVKVHTDAQAEQLNQSIQAKAFTTGQDMFFRSGEYNPGSRGGQELIAHELTHVVQQNGGAVLQRVTSFTLEGEQTVSPNQILRELTHDRTGVSNAARNAAMAKDWESVPTGSVCNHHISYNALQGAIAALVEGEGLSEVLFRLVAIANAMLNDREFNGRHIEAVNELGQGTDQDRQVVMNAINYFMYKICDAPNNLFFWPSTTGGRWGEFDLPASVPIPDGWMPKNWMTANRESRRQSRIQQLVMYSHNVQGILGTPTVNSHIRFDDDT